MLHCRGVHPNAAAMAAVLLCLGKCSFRCVTAALKVAGNPYLKHHVHTGTLQPAANMVDVAALLDRAEQWLTRRNAGDGNPAFQRRTSQGFLPAGFSRSRAPFGPWSAIA